MREINYIVVHCTGASQRQSITEIKNYWRNVKGWNSPGYHYIITPDGAVTNLQPLEKTTNGVAGYNAHSVHVCYIGGVDENNKPLDNRTEQQKISLRKIVSEMKEKFPTAKVLGHRDFPNVKKACPSFDVAKNL